MPSSTLPAKEREILDRINRDIAEGFRLGILTVHEMDALSRQLLWAVCNPAEWEAIKKLHHARSGFTRLFESRETTDRLPYVRSSYLKMLGHTNPATQMNWNYTIATAWKEALLNDQNSFVSRKGIEDLRRVLSRSFTYVPKSGRTQERGERGDVGGVTLFEWQGLVWAFKPETNVCEVDKARDSGIPRTNARMHNRSVASYLLANALGLQRIMVQTDFAYYQGAQQLEAGVLMEGASGLKPLKLLPSLQHLRDLCQGVNNMETIRRNWVDVLRPYRAQGLTTASFMKYPLANDLFAANWLDYIAAQMDRHLGNVYFNFSRTGVYQGLKLIDNDMAFGTETDPERLKGILQSSNCGIPNCIPPGLGARIRSIAQAIADPSDFWGRCQEGVPLSLSAALVPNAPPQPQQANLQDVQPHLPPQQARPRSLLQQRGRSGSVGDLSHPVPRGRSGSLDGAELPAALNRQAQIQPAASGNAGQSGFVMVQNSQDSGSLTCMAEIAGLITRNEFISLMQRMNIAGQRAAHARELNEGAFDVLRREYTTVTDRYATTNDYNDARPIMEMENKSYWHRALYYYHPISGIQPEYANPPKSPEEWLRGGRRV